MATSTGEAEYVAANTAAREASWIREFLTEIGHAPDGPIPIHCDSSTAKLWAENISTLAAKQYIKVAYNFVRQKV